MTKHHLFVAALLMLAVTGCLGSDDEPQEETSESVSAIQGSHSIYNPYWGQYLRGTSAGTAPLSLYPSVDNWGVWYLDRISGTDKYRLRNDWRSRVAGHPECLAASSTSNHLVFGNCLTYDPGQRWQQILASVDGVAYVQFKNEFTGMCLDTFGGA